jgi:hypothetical protein
LCYIVLYTIAMVIEYKTPVKKKQNIYFGESAPKVDFLLEVERRNTGYPVSISALVQKLVNQAYEEKKPSHKEGNQP